MKYTDDEIQLAIELSEYAADKCSELEDYSIKAEENIATLMREQASTKILLITTPISLLIGLLIGLLI